MADLRLYRQLAADRHNAFSSDWATSLTNLGSTLNALGQRENAIDATDEAIAIRRQIAADRAHAFNPDLALSLAVCANCLDGLGRTDEALANDVEAIRVLQPMFLRLPQAVAHWMRVICRQYVERCRKLSVEPDAALLGPIDQVFRKLEEAE